ncbi:hypothetical protein LR48_Vigan07g254500 [Vigna angularis]|uniref:Uncharacterized protein n=2 Tax=Phaseolus angularis TaxID=3914 RepID=A0A0L9V1K6_PHAAN|nr:uncharacterized protein LOC108337896 [Vigna angularis]KOM48841.1 hypothetical protein LR48_Vigan07g254500 [Vigna angularis]BAT82482.1 hypothetical protein VIGAN_03250900 [Vigna angularis var. angularis]
MKSKSICFCIRGRHSKRKESKVEDLEKHVKPNYKVKTKGCDPRSFVGDGGDSNVHGGSMVGSNDTGVSVAVISAAHMSMSGNEDGCGNGHMGESGADAGGD